MVKKKCGLLSTIMATVFMFTCIPVQVNANAVDEQLTPTQRYVRELTHYVNETEYSVQYYAQNDDTYYQKKTLNGFLSILTGDLSNKMGVERLEEKGYRTFWLKAISEPVINAASVPYVLETERLESLTSLLVDTLDNKALSLATTLTTNMTSTFSRICQEDLTALYAPTVLLEGLEMVGGTECASHHQNVKFAAQEVYDCCTDTAARNMLTIALEEGESAAFDWVIDFMTGGVYGCVSDSLTLLVGDQIDAEWIEFYGAACQSTVKEAFFEYLETYGGNNYLLHNYSKEEIDTLRSLAVLYLHCGYVSLKDTQPEKAERLRTAEENLVYTELPDTSQSISYRNVALPGEYALMNTGDKFVTTGVITAKSQFKEVKIEILREQEVVLGASDYNINEETYDLLKLDLNLDFSKLVEGNYIYKVSASTEDVNSVLVLHPFTVHPQNNEKLTDYRLPRLIHENDAFVVRGMVFNSHGKNVHVGIYTMDEKFITGATSYSQNDCFNLNELDRYVDFRILEGSPEGQLYRYHIQVGDNVLIDQPFVVVK